MKVNLTTFHLLKNMLQYIYTNVNFFEFPKHVFLKVISC